MQTHSLFGQSASTAVPPVPFAGADYNEARDKERLTTQLQRILAVMSDGAWRTVERLVSELRLAHPSVRFPEASVSAQLRNLRKIGYRVETRNILAGGLLYEYRVAAPENPGAAEVSA